MIPLAFILKADKEKASFIWFAFKLLNNKSDAEDLVQEAFIDVIQNKKNCIVEYKQLKNFIYRSLQWRYLNSKRRKKPLYFVALTEDMEPVNVEAAIEQIDINRIAPIIEKLNAKEREVLYLSLIGKSNIETANYMKLPLRQIQNLRYMACRKVREEDIKLNPRG